MEAGPKVRTVPSGLRRALIARDQGCIARRCSIPARWCQVAHLADPFHLEGRLSLDNAALMCHHHAQFDLHGWQMQWDAHRPRLFPPPSHSASHRIEDSAQLRHADLPPAEPPHAASGKDPTRPPAGPASPASHPKQGPPDPKSEQSARQPRQLPPLAQESRGTWNPRPGPNEHAVISAVLAGSATRAAYAAAAADPASAEGSRVRGNARGDPGCSAWGHTSDRSHSRDGLSHTTPSRVCGPLHPLEAHRRTDAFEDVATKRSGTPRRWIRAWEPMAATRHGSVRRR